MRKVNLKSTPKVFSSNFQPPIKKSEFSYSWLKPASLVVVIVLIIIGLSQLPIFKIKSIEAEGIDDQTKTSLNELIGVSIFSKRIVLKQSEIERTNLIIRNLECRRAVPASLICRADYRTAVVVWKNQDKTFYLDQEGFSFQEIKDLQPSMLIIEDRFSTGFHLGDRITSSNDINKYLFLADLLNTNKMKFESFYLVGPLFQIGVNLNGYESASGYIDKKFIGYFATTESLENQITALKAVLENSSQTINTSVDLRVPGRVFIK